jgi:malate dehydrogenase (quinone)
VLESKDKKYAALRDYFPHADAKDWNFIVAGQRVQVIMPDKKRGGKLQFGTEVVSAADGSLAAVLGASPGASVAVAVMLDVIRRLYGDRVAEWASKFKEILPSYGESIENDATLCERSRAETAEILHLAKVAV